MTTKYRKRLLIIAGIISSMIVVVLLFSTNTNAATKSYHGTAYMDESRNENYKKVLKTFTIEKPGYLYVDLKIKSRDKLFDYTFSDTDKIRTFVEGYDNNGKVIFSGPKLFAKIREDDIESSAWYYYGFGKYKIPAGRYKVWLKFDSIMNLYKVKYKIQYFTKTIKKIKLPKRIKMKVGKSRYIKIKNRISTNTFPCIIKYKQSNKKVVSWGEPTKKGLFIYAKKRGKCKITVMSSYGIKTKVTVIVK